jgi:hypothetical protein
MLCIAAGVKCECAKQPSIFLSMTGDPYRSTPYILFHMQTKRERTNLLCITPPNQREQAARWPSPVVLFLFRCHALLRL